MPPKPDQDALRAAKPRFLNKDALQKALEGFWASKAAFDEAKIAEAIATYIAALPQEGAAGVAEPVAWNCIYPTYGHFTLKKHEAEQAVLDGATVHPLYTRPAPAGAEQGDAGLVERFKSAIESADAEAYEHGGASMEALAEIESFRASITTRIEALLLRATPAKTPWRRRGR